MAEAALEAKRPFPASVIESEVAELWLPYWAAFHNLSEHRSMSGGMVVVPERIKYTEISSYARDFGFANTRADLEEFYEIIRAMDAHYVAHYVEQAKAQVQKGATK